MNQDQDFSLTKMWNEADQKEIPERRRMAHPSMTVIAEHYQKMLRAGWKEVRYWHQWVDDPGELCWCWSPDCSLPYQCRQEGDHPNAKWLAHCHGDIWPARPVLFLPNRVRRSKMETTNQPAGYG